MERLTLEEMITMLDTATGMLLSSKPPIVDVMKMITDVSIQLGEIEEITYNED